MCVLASCSLEIKTEAKTLGRHHYGILSSKSTYLHLGKSFSFPGKTDYGTYSECG